MLDSEREKRRVMSNGGCRVQMTRFVFLSVAFLLIRVLVVGDRAAARVLSTKNSKIVLEV